MDRIKIRSFLTFSKAEKLDLINRVRKKRLYGLTEAKKKPIRKKQTIKAKDKTVRRKPGITAEQKTLNILKKLSPAQLALVMKSQ